MVAYCCVQGCFNKKGKKSSLSFHSFPPDPLLKKKWLWAIGRQDWEPPSYARVCSAHFTAHQIKQECNRTRIKNDAYPLIALPVRLKYIQKSVAEEICRICLATDVNMYSLKDGEMRLYIDNIPGFTEKLIADGMPQCVCYECAAQLKKCWTLIMKSMRSKKILLDMVTQNGQIDKSLLNINREYLKLKSLLTFHQETPMSLYNFKYDDKQNTSILTNTEHKFISGKVENNDGLRYIPDIWPGISDNFENDSLTEEVILKMEPDNNVENSDSEYELIHISTDQDQTEEIFVAEVNDNIDDDDDITNIDPIEVSMEPIVKPKVIENPIEIDRSADTAKKKNKKPPKNPGKKKLRGRKSARINGLTPEEVDLQKYFDVIQISTLQEQIDDWKQMIGNTRMEGRANVTKCDLCSKHFLGDSYRRHMIYHAPSRGFIECPVCKIRFKCPGKLRSHLSAIHGRKFKCRSCPKIYRSLSAAKNHQKFHFGHQHKCDHCTYSTMHRSSLFAHIQRNHSLSMACEICGRSCISLQSLQQHRAYAHAGYRSVERVGVGGPFKVVKVSKDGKFTNRLMNTYYSKKSPNITVPWRFEGDSVDVRTFQAPEDGEVYPCEDCNFKFNSENARRVHLLTSVQHRDVSRLNQALQNACRMCGARFQSAYELTLHRNAEHRSQLHPRERDANVEYPIKCDYCDASLLTRRDHFWHVRRQHPAHLPDYKPLVTAVCETCGKGCQSMTQLRFHELRHSNPRERCEQCGRMFYDKFALARHHANSHRDERPYSCDLCGRAFKIKGNLARHMRIHTGEMPYQCSICSRRFRQRSSFKLHVRTVHLKMPHPPRKKRKPKTRNATTIDSDTIHDSNS